MGFLRPCARRYRGQEQGLALVLTLFVVALVTVLVLEYHFDASVEIDLATNYASDVQAYHLALAGVRFAQALLQQAPKDTNGPEDTWYKLGLVPACFSPQQLLDLATASLGDALPTERRDAKTAVEPRMADQRLEDMSQGAGCVSLRITDENSKLPINALRPPNGDENQPPPPVWVSIFQKFFESFKIDPEVVDALIDWLDTGDNPRGTGGAERSYYQSLPVPYVPPNGPMRTPGELRLVKGLNDVETLAKLFPGATPEAVADLDLGSNNYLTPFGAEETQAATPAGSQTSRQTSSQTSRQTSSQTSRQTSSQTSGQATNQAVKVNVNTASPEVLKALIVGAQDGAQTARSNAESVVEEIVAKRQEKKLKNLNEAVQDASLQQTLGSVADVKSTYFRIESIGVVGIVQKKIVAVLKRDAQQANQANPANQANQMTMLYFKVE